MKTKKTVISKFRTTLFSMICFIVFDAMSIGAKAQTPILGTYPNTSLTAGRNTAITPSNAPTNALKMVANTNTNFTGILSVDSITGIVNITNAKQAGTYIIKVKAFGDFNLVDSTTFTLTVTNPECGIGISPDTSNVNIGNVQMDIAIGDFNNDGNQDFVTGKQYGATVSIRMGDGMGGFIIKPDAGVYLGFHSLEISDYNGDGKQDIAVANAGSSYVSILIGDGTGGFTHLPFVSVGASPYGITSGDFNGDGKKDIATANYYGQNVTVRLGDGNGNFSGGSDIGSAQGFKVAVGDFNNDGKQDIVSTHYGNHIVSALLGNGDGTFTSINTLTGFNFPYGIAVGYFNNDTYQDIAITNYGGSTISIRYGTGTGNFNSTGGTPEVTVGSHPIAVVVGDFNGDGKQDIASANNNSNSVSIRYGDGNGNFSGNANFNVGVGPVSLVVADFNNDNRHDIAVANGSSNYVTILYGSTSEINAMGNNVSIVDGDITPGSTNHTDFGTVAVGSNLVRTFTIQNTGTANLAVNNINVSGTDISLFTISGITLPTTITTNSYATFNVTYSPTSAGLKTATVNIVSNDCDEGNYDFAVQGVDNVICYGGSSYYLHGTVTSGGIATGSGGNVSYSIGQPVYKSVNAAGGNVNQGVQQAQSIRLCMRLFLSGAYDVVTGWMRDSLREYNLIPNTEPYTSVPYSKPALVEAPGETLSPSALAVTMQNAIVDWVFIELRSATDPADILVTKRALVQRDGDVVSHVDGLSPVTFVRVPVGNYYVSVKHRNHLGVMTASPLFLSPQSSLIDFTTLPLVYVINGYINTPRRIEGSAFTLWAGDANNNKSVKYNNADNDRSFVLDAIISFPGSGGSPNYTIHNAYRREDVNMDGKVRYNNTDNDKSVILNTVGVSTPHNIFYQHTPN